MIATDFLHSNEECQEKVGIFSTLLQEGPSSLFSPISFGRDRAPRAEAKAEEIVWIEGTLTVSF